MRTAGEQPKNKSMISFFANRTWKQGRFLLLLCIVLLSSMAWMNRFIQDDAFISFRYAANLIDGHGLVWNVGEVPVEGYSNFLWTVLIAGTMAIGCDPSASAMVLGVLFFAGTLSFTFRLCRQVGLSFGVSLLGVVLLGTNFSFSSYATGGLETQLQAFLLTGGAFLTFYLTDHRENRMRVSLRFLSAQHTSCLHSTLVSMRS